MFSKLIILIVIILSIYLSLSFLVQIYPESFSDFKITIGGLDLNQELVIDEPISKAESALNASLKIFTITIVLILVAATISFVYFRLIKSRKDEFDKLKEKWK